MAENKNTWVSSRNGYAPGVVLRPKKYSTFTTAFRFEIHKMQVGQVFAVKMVVVGAGWGSRVLPLCSPASYSPRVKIRRDTPAYAGLVKYTGDPLREGGGGTPFMHLELASAPVGGTPGMVVFEVRPVADADNPITAGATGDGYDYMRFKPELKIDITGSLFTPNESCDVLVPVTGIVRVFPTTLVDPGTGELDSCWPV